MEFPRGVADERGRRAVVHDRHGTLIALRLVDGTELWRHGRELRPLAVLDRVVVALRVGTQAPAAAVVVLDVDDGGERWTSPPLPLPDWVRPTPDDTPAFTLHTEALGPDRLALRWVARSWYGGGAPPDRERLAEQTREARGGILVDLTGPSPEVSSGLPDAEQANREPPNAEPPEPGPLESASAGQPPLAPDVVRAARVGDLRMELAVGPHTGAVLLRAVDVRTDSTRWEVELDATTARRPPRLRP
ncbi:PQQ-binding-like beta-propeller repeat protein [Kitasatospora sp. NE20-6]|uniref:outer membrane protein assembly factor BamB family protein n=1 Tax=Kitasatospora sp. NE20-6 TaxID=2859066 RepID=UPI0038B3EB10